MRFCAAAQYTWEGPPSPLTTITDPVSKRAVKLTYGAQYRRRKKASDPRKSTSLEAGCSLYVSAYDRRLQCLPRRMCPRILPTRQGFGRR